MHAAIDQLYAEKDDVTGVVVDLGQEDVLRRRQPQGHACRHSRRRPGGLRDVRGHQGRPAPARDLRQAGRGGHQRRRARRWPRDHPRVPPPHRGRRPEARARAPRGHPRPAARRWRGHPHRADVRHPVGADGHPAAGHPVQAGSGQGEGPRRRAGQGPRRPRPRREEVDQGPPGRPAGRVEPLGPRRLQDPRGQPVDPVAGRLPAGVPGDAAQADQGRALPGPAGDHGRGHRGRAGRLRHREPDRVALPRAPDRRARTART